MKFTIPVNYKGASRDATPVGEAEVDTETQTVEIQLSRSVGRHTLVVKLADMMPPGTVLATDAIIRGPEGS